MSTTYKRPMTWDNDLKGSSVRKAIRLTLKSQGLSRAELDLLSEHHLKVPLSDELTWETEAFQLWMRMRHGRRTGDGEDTATHESKFAPTAMRVLSSVRGAHDMPWQFKWTKPFRRCAVASDRAALESAPREVVYDCGENWAHGAGLPLFALAWACVQHAVEGGPREGAQPRMAWIATRLFKTFADKSPVIALVFGEMLKRCVWEEFEAWWKPGKWCLTSSSYKGNQGALDLALAGILFIGELYSRHMLPPSVISHILNVLLFDSEVQWVVIEQLRAARLLMPNMDRRLMRADPMVFNKIHDLFSRSCKLAVGSWMNEAVEQRELSTMWQYVDRMVRFWVSSPPSLQQEAFPGQPVVLPIVHSIGYSAAPTPNSSGISSPTTSFHYRSPAYISPSSSLLYTTTSPSSSVAARQ